MDRHTPSSFHFRVFACSGDERQQSSADRLAADIQLTPNGIQFELNWIAPGYKYRASVLATIDREVAKAAVVLVGLRVAHGIRAAVIKSARAHGVPVVQLRGSGTGVTGLLRAAGDAVDGLGQAGAA